MLKILLISMALAFGTAGCSKKRSYNARVARSQQENTTDKAQAKADGKSQNSTDGKVSGSIGNAPEMKTGSSKVDGPDRGMSADQNQPHKPEDEKQNRKNESGISDSDEGLSLPRTDYGNSHQTGEAQKSDASVETQSTTASTQADPKKSAEQSRNTGEPKTNTNTLSNKATSEKQESSDNEEFLKLTFEQTFNFIARMQQNFSQETLKLLMAVRLPEGMDGSALQIKVEGDRKKATYTLRHKSDVVVELKDIEFSLSKQTKIDAGDYKLIGLCVDAQCSVLFLSLYKIEDKNWNVNIPIILAWNGERYQTAEPMSREEQAQYIKDNNIDPEEYQAKMAEALKEGKSTAPPQLRVSYQLAENFKTNLPSLVNSLGNRMKKDNSIYSARLFPNVKSGSFDWKLKATPQGLQVGVKIEFADGKAAQDYSGTISERGGRLKDAAGSNTLDIYNVLPNEFFLMIFENTRFESELPNSKRAIQAVVCQILVEEGETFSECQFVPSTYVLGIQAQEGRIGGPALINRGVVKDQYTPIAPQEFVKQLNEAGS